MLTSLLILGHFQAKATSGIVGVWEGRLRYHSVFSDPELAGRATADDRLFEARVVAACEPVRLRMVIRPGGTYTLRARNLPSFMPFDERGRWGLRPSGYFIAEPTIGRGLVWPLKVSGDGRHASFFFRGAKRCEIVLERVSRHVEPERPVKGGHRRSEPRRNGR